VRARASDLEACFDEVMRIWSRGRCAFETRREEHPAFQASPEFLASQQRNDDAVNLRLTDRVPVAALLYKV
jgi:hypothetical protein